MNSVKTILTTWAFCLLSSALCPLAFSQAVSKIAAGYRHSLFQKSDGSLWGMGWNWAGQLGDGTTNDMVWPERIISSNVVSIAAGSFHSLFLKSDGSLWAMGYNASGQLGDGTTTNRPNPVQIVSSNVTTIAAGGFHSLFLKSDNSLWAMGWNASGQLGDGTTDSGTYVTNRPEQIVSSNVIAIAAGANHSLFIKSDSSLWGMGGRSVGELGDGTSPPPYYTNSPEQIVFSGVVAI